MKEYEFFEHTADVGVKAYGKDLGEAFGNAARGMFAILTKSEVKEVGEFELHLEADDLEQLLVDWLSELLYLYEVDELLFSAFDVSIEKDEEGAIKLLGKTRGERIDKEKHEITTAIKAVTYHMIEVNEEEGFVKVLFDV